MRVVIITAILFLHNICNLFLADFEWPGLGQLTWIWKLMGNLTTFALILLKLKLLFTILTLISPSQAIP